MHIRRRVSKSLTTFKTLRFGQKTVKRSDKRYKVTVGIGGNIGNVLGRFNHLLIDITRDKRVDIVQTSLVLKNPPFGFIDQDDFLNSIVVLQVDMQAKVFLAYLLRLEKKFGRKRSFPDAPRTLDLDIIFFDNKIINTKNLTVPHSEYLNRQSVMIPLESMK